jgi:fumarate reductase flavoprotein subunit
MPDVVVAGAGVAGLVAAAEARRLGADVLVFEKLDRPGGSMRLSSPGDLPPPRLSAIPGRVARRRGAPTEHAVERLDADLRWLEGLGARPFTERGTGNPLTTGLRVHPPALTEALVRAGGGLQSYDADGVIVLGNPCSRRRTARR